MTEEQRQIFWNHFKVLEKDGIQYSKPPSTWKPPSVRDMGEEELQAYWNAFRSIMIQTSERITNPCDDQPVALEPAPKRPRCGDANPNHPHSDDTPVSEPPAKKLRCMDGDEKHMQAPTPVSSSKMIRLRGKTRPDELENRLEALRKKTSLCAKSSKRSHGDPPPKRKYSKNPEVQRKGNKQSSVSIWRKVQLFKEPGFNH